MKKNRLLLKLILIWIAIYFLIVLVNQIIFWRPHQSYTSLLASYLVCEGMPRMIAVLILGSLGNPFDFTNSAYATFGGGMVVITTDGFMVEGIRRYDTYGAWVFYGFMLSVAIAEAIIYFRLRKEEVAS